MRGREFLMKDAYSFDIDYAGAKHAYNKMFLAYLRTFDRLGLRAIPMQAESGPIGGNLSHEFIILAETGESEVFCDRDWMDMDLKRDDVSYDDDLEPLFRSLTGLYAATDEKHDPGACPIPADRLVTARGIEVGHIFYFGEKYSKAMGAAVAGPNGEPVHYHMGSYGIGVSRLVGAPPGFVGYEDLVLVTAEEVDLLQKELQGKDVGVVIHATAMAIMKAFLVNAGVCNIDVQDVEDRDRLLVNGDQITWSAPGPMALAAPDLVAV
jgi:hypothetical protein